MRTYSGRSIVDSGRRRILEPSDTTVIFCRAPLVFKRYSSDFFDESKCTRFNFLAYISGILEFVYYFMYARCYCAIHLDYTKLSQGIPAPICTCYTISVCVYDIMRTLWVLHSIVHSIRVLCYKGILPASHRGAIMHQFQRLNAPGLASYTRICALEYLLKTRGARQKITVVSDGSRILLRPESTILRPE